MSHEQNNVYHFQATCKKTSSGDFHSLFHWLAGCRWPQRLRACWSHQTEGVCGLSYWVEQSFFSLYWLDQWTVSSSQDWERTKLLMSQPLTSVYMLPRASLPLNCPWVWGLNFSSCNFFLFWHLFSSLYVHSGSLAASFHQFPCSFSLIFLTFLSQFSPFLTSSSPSLY